jgi:hypothetical protein
MPTKRIKRKVIGITKSRELTQQGNPVDYWYVLECGHTTFESHKAKTHIDYLLMREAKDHDFQIKKFCRYCQNSKPINKEQTANIIGRFRTNEANDKILEMYKKYKS